MRLHLCKILFLLVVLTGFLYSCNPNKGVDIPEPQPNDTIYRDYKITLTQNIDLLNYTITERKNVVEKGGFSYYPDSVTAVIEKLLIGEKEVWRYIRNQNQITTAIMAIYRNNNSEPDSVFTYKFSYAPNGLLREINRQYKNSSNWVTGLRSSFFYTALNNLETVERWDSSLAGSVFNDRYTYSNHLQVPLFNINNFYEQLYGQGHSALYGRSTNPVMDNLGFDSTTFQYSYEVNSSGLVTSKIEVPVARLDPFFPFPIINNGVVKHRYQYTFQ